MKLILVVTTIYLLFEHSACGPDGFAHVFPDGFDSIEKSIEMDKHHDQGETLSVLHSIHTECAAITKIYKIGDSVMGNGLNVIEFNKPGRKTAKNKTDRKTAKPEVKYIGNMHGNEVVGKEMLLILAQYLCKGYNADIPWVVELVDRVTIAIMPTMNPDGWMEAFAGLSTDGSKVDWYRGRSNANQVDLNRSFPDLDLLEYDYEKHGGPNSHLFDEWLETKYNDKDTKLQPETKAMIKWILSRRFSLSANFHGGDLVANYPFDESRNGATRGAYAASPDDEIFRYLAAAYADSHTRMADPARRPCEMSDAPFPHGITNGADWYSVSRGMQDFNYLASDCFEITVEMGCTKFPEASELHRYWVENRNAMVHYLSKVLDTVSGVIYDADTKKPIDKATISLDRIAHDVSSGSDGEYFRLAIPGESHAVHVEAEGYVSATRSNCHVGKGDCDFGLIRSEVSAQRHIADTLTDVAEDNF